MRNRVRGFGTKTLATIAVTMVLVGGAWAASNGKLVYGFTGGGDGSDPATGLTFDSTGNGYGTTVSGGFYGYGTVFELKRLAGGNFQEVVLYSFRGAADGKNPYGGVAFDGSGNLYGTTVSGGSGGVCTGDGCGVVFKLTNSGGNWTESVLYNFTGGDDGSGPGGGVVFDGAGNLYGTTPDGGKFSAGVVYELSPQGNTWQQTVIHAFTGGDDGATGSLGLLLLANGNFYGVSEGGGAHGAGTVFQLSPMEFGKWKFTTLYGFKGMPDAAFPYGGLITDGKNNLYGTTYYGGVNGVGAVFKLDGTTKKETVLYSFAEGTDGGYPTSTLVFDAAGNMYGTTSMGGLPACDCGTVFELSPVNGGVKETILHRFKEKPDGGYPYYGLHPDPSGNLFSTTASGGNSEAGIVFEFTP
ncbi:MAG TPA: choice-of-anchor tandem repeat GloVer-containing protein [Terriglobales bacterium]|nr:choice-of-anchor tandem repeat GloVer-containing protein [Terriglobales bacterium]